MLNLPKCTPFRFPSQETSFRGAWKGQRPNVRTMHKTAAQTAIKSRVLIPHCWSAHVILVWRPDAAVLTPGYSAVNK